MRKKRTTRPSPPLFHSLFDSRFHARLPAHRRQMRKKCEEKEQERARRRRKTSFKWGRFFSTLYYLNFSKANVFRCQEIVGIRRRRRSSRGRDRVWVNRTDEDVIELSNEWLGLCKPQRWLWQLFFIFLIIWDVRIDEIETIEILRHRFTVVIAMIWLRIPM